MQQWLSVLAPAYAEIFLLGMICVIMLVDLMLSESMRWVTYILTQLTLIVAAVITWHHWGLGSQITFSGQFINDNMAVLLKEGVYLMGFAVFMYARQYIGDQKMMRGEFYLLGLLSIAGALVLISANSLLTLYLGLELLSLPLYAMVAMRRDNALSAEAAMKYFVMGGLASGLFLFGVSLLYGITHTIMLPQIMGHIPADMVGQAVTVFALILMIAGITFKFGAVPFHMWVPDVYQGAPTAVTAFIGTVPKIAAFALLTRLIFHGMVQEIFHWTAILEVLAILSLLVGNVLAVVQTNLKRLLAYSTVANVGFILLGFATGTIAGLHAALFYTLTYVLMAVGGFGLLIILSRNGQDTEQLSDLKGLNYRNSWLALMMMLILLSFAGIPPLVGFTAKLLIITNLVNLHHYYLAGFALIMSVVAAYYYLRVICVMYFEKPKVQCPPEVTADGAIALSVNGLLLLGLGLAPAALLQVVMQVSH